MDVISAGILPVSSLLWRPNPSTWILTVVTKATFLLRAPEAELALQQDAPHEEDGYWNDDPTRSLRYASDLVPAKQRAEVVLIGKAFAPPGPPVRSLIARLVV